MRKSLVFCLTAGFCVLTLGRPATAEIVYFDATSGAGGNTTLADGSTFSPPLNGTTGNDNNWEQRTPFASGGTVFESTGEAAGQSENAPELRTRISGLVANQEYSVFAYFWDPTSALEDWNMRAGLTSNPSANTLFAAADSLIDFTPTASAGILASTQTFTTAPTIFLESGRALLAAPLGTAMANGLGEIDVFVDDLGAAGTVNRRTWFDGVGVGPVAVPEPSSVALVGLGLGAYVIRRRKRS